MWREARRQLFSIVMRGQKRVEDARKRAYYPRIHFKKNASFKPMDCRVNYFL
jgi:hypothetical protein